MDLVFIKKIIAHFLYPTGFISLLIFLVLLCAVLRYKKIARLFAVLAIVIFLISSNRMVANHLAQSLEAQYPQFAIADTPNADVIVVLGGSLSPPAKPRKFTQLSGTSNRFWLAAQLYKAGKAPKIVLSGGNVFAHSNIQPEAHYIRQHLLELGVADADILIEGDSRTTGQNADLTARVLTKLQTQQPITKALLITSAIHMPRSMKLFSKIEAQTNIDFIPVSSDINITEYQQPLLLQLIPNAGALGQTTAALHEYYGMLAIKLRSLISLN